MKKIMIIKLFKRYYPVLTIIFVWFIFSSPYFLRGLVPFPADYLVSFFPPWNSEYAMPVKNNAMPDIITQIYPWKKITVDTWKSGQVPLWNPYAFSGTVHAANYQSAVFTPFNILFFLLPFIDAWSLLILFQPLLAGLLMYALMRKLEISKPGALLSAIAFMFSGFLTVWLAYGTLGYALLFLPLVILGLVGVCRGERYHGILVFCGLALSFLSGHFQISLYVMVFSFVFAVLYGLGRNRKSVMTAIAMIILGTSAAALQILPTLEAYFHSARSGSFIRGEVIPWSYLPTLFAPDVFGNPVTRNDWFGHYAEWNGYIGVIPLILAVVALFSTRRRLVLFFGAASLVSILLAFDTPLNRLLFILRLPAISTSAASRVLSVFVFSSAALAGFGFDWFVRVAGKKFRPPKYFPAFLVAAGFLYLLFVFGLLPLTLEQREIAFRNSLLPAALAGIFIIGLLARWRFGFSRKFVTVIFLVVTVFDLWRFSVKWLPFSDRSFVYPPSDLLTYLEGRVRQDYGRVFGNFGGEVNASARLPLTEGYDAMYRERYGRFVNLANGMGLSAETARSVVLFGKAGPYSKPALDFLGVRYFVHRKSDGRNVWAFPVWNYPDSLKLVYEDDAYDVYENQSAFPRAYLVGQFRITDSETELSNLIFSDGVNLLETVFLPGVPRYLPETGDGLAEIVFYSPTRVTVRSRSAVPKILVMPDVFAAGWQASVDGRKEPVLRADYVFRAVSLPAGEHEIVMTYFPDSFRYGLFVSVISFLGLFIIIYRRRRSPL